MKLIIYGNGAMARLLQSQADIIGSVDIAAFTVDKAHITDSTLVDLPVVPWETLPDTHPADTHGLINSVGFVSMNDVRMERIREGIASGYQIGSFLHPSATTLSGFEHDGNLIVLEHTSIHNDVSVGLGVFIAAGCNLGHDVKIGEGVWINSGVCIGGGARIGNNCFVGMNATICEGADIAPYTYVPAGAVVARSDAHSVLDRDGRIVARDSHKYLSMLKAVRK